MAARNPGKLKQRRREDARRAVLEYLANRSVIAQSAETICTGINLNRKTADKFKLNEIEAAIEFQVGAGNISQQYDPHGATPYYKVSAEGVLFHERNQPNR